MSLLSATNRLIQAHSGNQVAVYQRRDSSEGTVAYAKKAENPLAKFGECVRGLAANREGTTPVQEPQKQKLELFASSAVLPSSKFPSCVLQ